MNIKKIISASLLLASCVSHASTETITINEILDALDSTDSSGELSKAIGDKIAQRIEMNETFAIDENDRLINADIPTIESSKSCVRAKISDIEVTAKANKRSAFSVTSSGLNKPMRFKADVTVHADLSADISNQIGASVSGPDPRNPFNTITECVYASPKVSGRIDMWATADMEVILDLSVNPSMVDLEENGIAIVIEPTIRLDGRVKDIYNVNFDIPRSELLGVFSSPLDRLEDEIRRTLLERLPSGFDQWAGLEGTYAVNTKFNGILEERHDDLRAKLAESLLSDEEFNSWDLSQPIVRRYELPYITRDIAEQMLAWVDQSHLRMPTIREFVLAAGQINNLYYSVMSGDFEHLRNALGVKAACIAAQPLVKDMPVISTSTPYQTENYDEFCNNLSDPTNGYIGNADIWDGDGNINKTNWMLTPGTTLDIGVLPIEGNHQPYMQKVKYKTYTHPIDTSEIEWICDSVVCYPANLNDLEADECKLEMRVYKKDPTATNLKPLMAIHGGSWMYRSFVFLSLEAMVSHFTEKGFAVFAPFYRLTGSSDGNAECNGANGEDIIEDIEDALDWVRNNAGSYGAQGEVYLFGQSAGAHLAGHLSMHNGSKINKTMLMYPPTDFEHYLATYNSDTPSQGSVAIERFVSHILGTDGIYDLEDLRDVNHPFVAENSFPQIARDADDKDVPPMYILHGVNDTLVPSTHSVRMCNGLAKSGNLHSGAAINNGGYPSSGIYKQTYQCGDSKGELHLFAEARHVMDLKCFGAGIEESLCRAGSANTANAVANSIASGINWLQQPDTRNEGSTPPINCDFYNPLSPCFIGFEAMP